MSTFTAEVADRVLAEQGAIVNIGQISLALKRLLDRRVKAGELSATLQIVTWKKNGLRLRLLSADHIGRHGERRLLVQKETAEGANGMFSVKPEDVA